MPSWMPFFCSSTRRWVQEKHPFHKESEGSRFFAELLVSLYSLLRLSSAKLEIILCSSTRDCCAPRPP